MCRCPIESLISYAKSFIGLPYIWGGSHPSQGYDCSGLVQEILASVGMDPKLDQTAQMLADYFLLNGVEVWEPKPGALAFYGKNKEHITHVAFCISPFLLIEAGGGDSTCTSVDKAIAKKAFVRIRPTGHRSDRVLILMPNYADWVRQLELPLG